LSNKKILYGLIGLALGFIVGFMWTRDFNSRNASAGSTASERVGGSGGTGGGPSQQAMMANVRETVEKARNNPKDYNAQIAAASVYDQIGRTAEAVDFMKKAYDINATEAAKLDIPAYLGEWYLRQKDYQESERWYRRALETQPNSTDFLTELGATFVEREPPDLAKGIQYLEAALKSDPKNGHAMMHLAQSHLMKGDAKSAEEWLTKLKQTDPKNQSISLLETQLEALKAGKPVNLPKE
jgi:Tfp pilus assembly protein PilF